MPRRRMRDEWGSITEVERGRRYRIRYWSKDSSGEYRRRSVTVRGTRRDAEKRRAELMLDHSEDAPCPTVGQIWEKWAHPAYERRVDDGDLAPKSLQQYESMWSAHVSPRWTDVPCDSVKPLAVQQWLDGMGASQASDAMSVLRPTLDYAVRYGVIETNPFRERYLMPSKRTVQSRDKGIWTYDQLHEVWNHVRGQWHEGAFLLAAFAGLRVGESLGVRADEVHELHGCAMVPVERQMPNRGTSVTERLKNPQSERVVPVPGVIGTRLLELSGDAEWISGDGLGNPNTQTRLTREWSRTCAALPDGLAHPFRNLRNSYETNMRWVMKLPPWVVEPLMGHQSKGVTGQYYDRPTPEMIAASVAEAYAACRYDAGWDG